MFSFFAFFQNKEKQLQQSREALKVLTFMNLETMGQFSIAFNGGLILVVPRGFIGSKLDFQ